MNKVRAFLVGVCDYSSHLDVQNLPYSCYDIKHLSLALQRGLCVDIENITLLGLEKVVTSGDFLKSFSVFIKSIEPDDTIIFYFSGHGYIKNDKDLLKNYCQFLPF